VRDRDVVEADLAHVGHDFHAAGLRLGQSPGESRVRLRVGCQQPCIRTLHDKHGRGPVTASDCLGQGVQVPRATLCGRIGKESAPLPHEGDGLDLHPGPGSLAVQAKVQAAIAVPLFGDELTGGDTVPAVSPNVLRPQPVRQMRVNRDQQFAQLDEEQVISGAPVGCISGGQPHLSPGNKELGHASRTGHPCWP